MISQGEPGARAVRTHRWIVTDPPLHDRVEKLCRELNIPPAISRILLQRGIDDYDKAKAYFRPTLQLLHDPFLMDGMREATSRISRALSEGEQILVFGDYDVDGTNGAAMVCLFLKKLGGKVESYIPNRMKEGYGISRAGIDRAHMNGASLFIAVDCGITAIDQVEYARGLGIDVIICDHHEAGGRIPNAVAVLDPHKPGDTYPFKGLCGCGVAFKLIQAMARVVGKEDLLRDYLDFVALATTADIVPLNGENRILVKIGLEPVNKNPRVGIKALIESAGLKPGQITTGQIVFALAPRINAVGRLGDAMRAVKLLISEDEEEGQSLARILEEENRNRRKIDEDTFTEAQALAEETGYADSQSAIVLHQVHWHPGVIGIVASRMVEKYYKPSIMMATVDGVAKGSARSVPGFDIYEALKKCQDKLIQFGGHKYAAGLSVEASRFDEFREAFNAVVQETLPEELKTPTIKIDTEISLSELTPRFIRILGEFAPFGPGNVRPTFLSRNVEVTGIPRIVGKNHLRFRVKQNGAVFDAIGFGLGHFLAEVSQAKGRNLHCLFSIDENDRGRPSGGPAGDGIPQLKIRDLRLDSHEELMPASSVESML